MRKYASPTTGSRTASYLVCAVLVAPVLPLVSLLVWNVVVSPLSVLGLAVLLMVVLIGTVSLLREREWQRDADT